MPEDIQSFLPYRSVDIYFIFSFAFDYQAASSEEIVDRLSDPAWQPDHAWESGLPPDRKGRPPYLRIKKRVGNRLLARTWSKCLLPRTRTRLEYTETLGEDGDLTANAENKDEFEVHVEAWARTFDSGAGCITFKVSLDKDVSFRRVYETHSLSQRLFDRTASNASVELDGLNGNLFFHFRRFLSKEIQQFNDFDPGTDQGDPEDRLIALLDEDVLDFEDDTLDAQNPYVLSVVEMDRDDVNSHFFSKPATDTLRFKELAAILFRLVYPYNFFKHVRRSLEFVRIPTELLVEGRFLRNYAWDARSMMCFSRTSSLFACFGKDLVPAALIRNSLLDTLEIVRTRWHMSILLNAQLDGDLQEFRKKEIGDTLFILDQLIKRRRQFAAFLHDPLPYSFEGGSVSKIADIAARELQLETLRRMTFEKLETLDQLHSDQMKHARLSDYSAFEAAVRRTPKASAS